MKINKMMSVIKEKQRLLILSILSFFLLLPYVKIGRFLDETDNLIGGMIVHGGGRVYGEFYSQHTPLMYYLSAVFTSLGADSVEDYRVLFYVFLIICFCFIYVRYEKIFGALPLVLYPLIYILSLGQIDGVSHTILSEHVQAQAMVVIFLELLLLGSSRNLKMGNAITISMASFIAVGTAFVSIYAVALAYVVIFLMLFQQEQEKSFSLKVTLSNLLPKYALTIFVAAFPFLLFLAWYAISNNIENLYHQAYWLNRHVYVKYNGGLGDSMVAPLINSFYGFFLTLINSFIEVPDSWWVFLRTTLNKIVFIAFIFTFLFRKKILFFGILFFVIFNTIRGDRGFHSIQYWAIMAMMLALILKELVNQSKKTGAGAQRLMTIGIVAVCGATIIIPYVVWVSKMLDTPPVTSSVKELSYGFYAKNLLSKNEGFLTTSIDSNQICYVESQRLPSTKAYTIVPWFTDLFEDEIIADLIKTKTKVIFHNPDNEVWGRVLKNYAPKLNKFILDNYRELDTKLRGVYIRKEFYDEALRKLIKINPEFFGVRYGLVIDKPEIPVGEISAGNVVEQTFISEKGKLRSVSILMATYMRKNSSDLKFSLLDENRREVFHKMVDAGMLEDNKLYDFTFPAVANSGAKKFSVEITAITGSPGNAVTAWMSKSDIYPNGTLTINGKSVDGDLSMRLLYER